MPITEALLTPLSTLQKYAWVDTCCIDKTSSAELTESINSMFKWYKKAVTCFAYLEDIDGSVAIRDGSLNLLYFKTARWFTRGWTLQELIAPKEVIFLSQDWTVLGFKSELSTQLQGFTGIDSWTLVSFSFHICGNPAAVRSFCSSSMSIFLAVSHEEEIH